MVNSVKFVSHFPVPCILFMSCVIILRQSSPNSTSPGTSSPAGFLSLISMIAFSTSLRKILGPLSSVFTSFSGSTSKFSGRLGPIVELSRISLPNSQYLSLTYYCIPFRFFNANVLNPTVFFPTYFPCVRDVLLVLLPWSRYVCSQGIPSWPFLLFCSIRSLVFCSSFLLRYSHSSTFLVHQFNPSLLLITVAFRLSSRLSQLNHSQ